MIILNMFSFLNEIIIINVQLTLISVKVQWNLFKFLIANASLYSHARR